jgi:hypothetical protein
MCRCCPGTPQQALSVHADLAVGTGSHHHHCRSETKIEGAGQFIGFYQRQQSLKLDVIITFYRTYLNFPAAHQQFETTFQQMAVAPAPSPLPRIEGAQLRKSQAFYRTYLNFPAAHQQFETTFQQIVRPRIQLRNQALMQ